MFGISGSHLLILLIVLIVFGPRRLPELGSTLGKAMRNFKDGLAGVQDAQFTRLGENDPSAQARRENLPPQGATAQQPATSNPGSSDPTDKA